MTIKKNAAEGQPSVTNETTPDVMMPDRQNEDILLGRILSQSARATARAYDEVFTLKHELTLAQQPERDRIAPQLYALQEKISELTRQLEENRPALVKPRLQQKTVAEKKRADKLQQHIDELLTSTSWRITSPLRRVSLALRRVKKMARR